jgi:hypothetical protein
MILMPNKTGSSNQSEIKAPTLLYSYQPKLPHTSSHILQRNSLHAQAQLKSPQLPCFLVLPLLRPDSPPPPAA